MEPKQVNEIRPPEMLPASGDHPLASRPTDIQTSVEERVQQITIDPIAALAEAGKRLGFESQLRQLVIVVLACLSAAAKCIFNVHLVGLFSSGKSTVVRAAADIVGEQFVVSSSTIWTITAAAAARMNERLRGRCLILDERAPNKELEGLLRMAASGFSAARTITLQGSAVDLIVEAKFAIVEALLDDKQMNRQDRSRYLRVRMPSDDASRDNISALSRSGFTIFGMRRRRALEDFARAFQVVLAQLRSDIVVVVPFADMIRMNTPSRIRDRLTKHVLNATQTVAWLRQQHRPQGRDEVIGQYILATAEDYRIVYEIVTAIGDDGADEELSDNALNLFRMWSAWARNNGNRGLKRDDFGCVTARSLSTMQTYRALIELSDAGYADGPRGRGRGGHWRLTEIGLRSEHPNLFRLLPRPDSIAEGMKNCNPPA